MDEAIEDFRRALRALDGGAARPRRRAACGARGLLRPRRARRAAQPPAGRRAGAARRAARARRARRQARQAARARTRDLEFAWASFLARAMQRGAIPDSRPAPARARDPRALQQHLALVPPERDRRARARRASSSPSASSRCWSAPADARRLPRGSPHDASSSATSQPSTARSRIVARARRRRRRVLDPLGRGHGPPQPPVPRRPRGAARVHRRRRHAAAGPTTCCSAAPTARRVRARRDALRRRRRAHRHVPRRRRSSTTTAGCSATWSRARPAIAFGARGRC